VEGGVVGWVAGEEVGGCAADYAASLRLVRQTSGLIGARGGEVPTIITFRCSDAIVRRDREAFDVNMEMLECDNESLGLVLVWLSDAEPRHHGVN
jgi:hypothetical protein